MEVQRLTDTGPCPVRHRHLNRPMAIGRLVPGDVVLFGEFSSWRGIRGAL